MSFLSQKLENKYPEIIFEIWKDWIKHVHLPKKRDIDNYRKYVKQVIHYMSGGKAELIFEPDARCHGYILDNYGKRVYVICPWPEHSNFCCNIADMFKVETYYKDSDVMFLHCMVEGMYIHSVYPFEFLKNRWFSERSVRNFNKTYGKCFFLYNDFFITNVNQEFKLLANQVDIEQLW